MHLALLALALPALVPHAPLQAKTSPPPHPNAVLDLVVPHGDDLKVEADEITMDQVSGEAQLSGSVVITLPGGAVLRPRNSRVFVTETGEKGPCHIYIEPVGKE